jgi:hypothetical protein
MSEHLIDSVELISKYKNERVLLSSLNSILEILCSEAETVAHGVGPVG